MNDNQGLKGACAPRGPTPGRAAAARVPPAPGCDAHVEWPARASSRAAALPVPRVQPALSAARAHQTPHGAPLPPGQIARSWTGIRRRCISSSNRSRPNQRVRAAAAAAAASRRRHRHGRRRSPCGGAAPALAAPSPSPVLSGSRARARSPYGVCARRCPERERRQSAQVQLRHLLRGPPLMASCGHRAPAGRSSLRLLEAGRARRTRRRGGVLLCGVRHGGRGATARLREARKAVR